jgi:hypothetical protein
VALEGAARRAGEKMSTRLEGISDGPARGEVLAGTGTRFSVEEAKVGNWAKAVPNVVEVLLVGKTDGIVAADLFNQPKEQRALQNPAMAPDLRRWLTTVLRRPVKPRLFHRYRYRYR